MFEKIKKLIKKNKNLSLDTIPRWSTDRCYQCGKILDKTIGDGYWSVFFKLDGKQYSAPICTECSNKNSLEGEGKKVFGNDSDLSEIKVLRKPLVYKDKNDKCNNI